MKSVGLSKHITSNQQIYVDGLSTSLKKVRKQLYYERRKLEFEKQLSRLQNRSNNWLITVTNGLLNILGAENTTLEYEQSRKEKERILIRLIKLSENLIIDTESKLHIEEYKKLEKELITYTDFFDWLFECREVEVVDFTNYYESEKSIKKILAQFVKKIKLSYSRDKRQFLRSLTKHQVRQHEEEEFNKNEFSSLFNSFLLTDYFISHGKRFYYRNIRATT